jgi:hypothetical protein
MTRISLAGTWNITCSDGLHGRMEHFLQPLTGSGHYLPCLLPGSIQAGLITNRWLKDPGIGINSLTKRVTWVLYHSLKPGGLCAVETGDNDF